MAARPLFERRLQSDRQLVWEDLQSIADEDYWGIEIFEGKLVVSPSPDTRHQSCVGSMYAILKAACPSKLKVIVAPYDYVPRPGYSLQPDVVVARRVDLGEQRLERQPVLVVEVISPSSRVTDRSLKRMVYEENGIQHYWIVDPQEPSITALQLVDGSYVESAVAADDEELSVDSPFSVRVVPRRLLDE